MPTPLVGLPEAVISRPMGAEFNRQASQVGKITCASKGGGPAIPEQWRKTAGKYGKNAMHHARAAEGHLDDNQQRRSSAA